VLLRHQAELEIASELGQGSTFSVRLPARRIERLEAPEARAEEPAHPAP
jgi:signal transduction histidine kinase